MQELLYEKRDGVAYLTLNRAEKRNAISPRMFVQLAEAWHDFRDDADCHVALLTGAGSESFCSGGDTELLVPLLDGRREPSDAWEERFCRETVPLQQAAFMNPFELYKPIVVAVNGHAISGGCELLHGTDIRIASSQAKFGLFEIKHGIIPAGGSLVRLQEQIPHCRAMEMVLLGGTMTAHEAQRIGLVNEVVAPDRVLPRAAEIAQRLAGYSPMAVQKAKEVMLRTRGMRLPDACALQQECWDELLTAIEAARAPG